MNAESLIINSPYERPTRHWAQDANGRVTRIVDGRRPAAYEMYDTRNNTRRVETLDTVNRIRQRVDDWRAAGWLGITMVTG
jgi:type III restriction enzyme